MKLSLSLSPTTIRSELTGARDLLDQLLASIDEDGIPGVTIPGGPEAEAHLSEWVMQFTGEVMLAARKCENVALTLAEPPGSAT